MSFRFRKTVNLDNGIRFNLSKSGIGWSWGNHFFRKTYTSKNKTRTTLTIPNSGLSHVSDKQPQNRRKQSVLLNILKLIFKLLFFIFILVFNNKSSKKGHRRHR